MNRKLSNAILSILLMGFVQGCWAENTKIPSEKDLLSARYETTKYNLCVINGLECSNRTEDEAISMQRDRVRRIVDEEKGNLLEVKCSDKKIQFRDAPINDRNGWFEKYVYIGYFPKAAYYLVENYQHGGESYQYILLSENSCKQFEMYGPPSISPNGKRFVSVRATEAGDKNEIMVWGITPNILNKEFHYQPEGYALYRFVEWEGDEVVSLFSYKASSEKQCKKGGRVKASEKLKFSDFVWALEVNKVLEVSCF